MIGAFVIFSPERKTCCQKPQRQGFFCTEMHIAVLSWAETVCSVHPGNVFLLLNYSIFNK